MARMPPLPNIFGNNQNTIIDDGGEFLAELREKLDKIRDRLEDKVAKLGFSRDEPLRFDDIADLTGIKTVGEYQDVLSSLTQATKRAEELREASVKIWSVLPVNDSADRDSFTKLVPKDIFIDILMFAYPYVMSMNNVDCLSEEDRAKIRRGDVIPATQPLLDRLNGQTTRRAVDMRRREMSKGSTQVSILEAATQYGPGLTQQMEVLREEMNQKETEAKEAQDRHIREMREKTTELDKAKRETESLRFKITDLDQEASGMRKKNDELAAALVKENNKIKGFRKLLDELAEPQAPTRATEPEDDVINEGQSQQDIQIGFKQHVHSLDRQIENLAGEKRQLAIRAETAEDRLRKEQLERGRFEQTITSLKTGNKQLAVELQKAQKQARDALEHQATTSQEKETVLEDVMFQANLVSVLIFNLLEEKTYHDQLKEDHVKLMGQRDDLEKQLEEQRGRHACELADAENAHREELDRRVDEQKRQYARELADAEKSHKEELDKRAGDQKRRHASELADVEKAHGEELDKRVDELKRQHANEKVHAEKAHEDAIKALEQRVRDIEGRVANREGIIRALNKAHKTAKSKCRSRRLEYLRLKRDFQSQVRDGADVSEQLETTRLGLEERDRELVIKSRDLDTMTRRHQTASSELAKMARSYNKELDAWQAELQSKESSLLDAKRSEKRWMNFFLGATAQGAMEAIAGGEEVAAQSSRVIPLQVCGTWTSARMDFDYSDRDYREVVQLLVLHCEGELTWSTNRFLALMRRLAEYLSGASHANTDLIVWLLSICDDRVSMLPRVEKIPAEAAIVAVVDTFSGRWGIVEVRSHRYLGEGFTIAAGPVEPGPTHPEFVRVLVDESDLCLVKKPRWPLAVMINLTDNVCWFIDPSCITTDMVSFTLQGPTEAINFDATDWNVIRFRLHAWGR
ncbi:hypothetical protein ColLi_09564 [Colletotrichum liriopes]|uniref:Uncharacterized protein n=1 Tax=Colletotrichum liriopes TaxID=708192 RepID=A0AA37LWF6_9PEZI|nr:hypothetical protein ColLi_09564 [Colletotrichum liriopes]